jgi:hypothetical protein
LVENASQVCTEACIGGFNRHRTLAHIVQYSCTDRSLADGRGLRAAPGFASGPRY